MNPTTTVARGERRLWIPLIVALAWMFGTFLVFWSTPAAANVPNPTTLIAFILAATVAFGIGYIARIRRYPTHIPIPDHPTNPSRARTLVLWSAAYYLLWGGSLLVQYGATGPAQIVSRITDPGMAYAAKFDVYQANALGGANPLIQVLTLVAVLSTVLIPYTVLYWRNLSIAVRFAAGAGITTYAIFFAYIGTLKGLGDIAVMTGAGALVATFGTWPRPAARRPHRRRLILLAVVALAAFGTYMASAQADRLEQYHAEHLFTPNETVASVIGDDLARGVAATMWYPTHGYLGLAHNLDTEFVWTHGLGSSRAVNTYVDRYVTPATGYQDSYPVRTEARTGYPAGQYWATIYPWLASDLTWPGTVAFMLVVGWWFARLWVEAAIQRRNLSLLLWVQLAIAIAYIPANNQLGIGSPSVIALVTLTAVYIWRQLNARRAAAFPPAEPARVRQAEPARHRR